MTSQLRVPKRELLIVFTLMLSSATVLAALPQEQSRLPDLDRRMDGRANIPVRAVAQAAKNQLQARLPKAQVEFDLISGAPKHVSARGDFLTRRSEQNTTTSSQKAGKFANDPNGVTKAFVEEYQELFGHGPEALDKARIKQEFVTPHNGLRTVVWEQQVDDIPLFESLFISHTTQDGQLVSVASQFVPDATAAANRGTSNRAAAATKPEVSARRATALAAQNIEPVVDESSLTEEGPETNVLGPEKRQSFKSPKFSGNAETKLIWLPMDSATLRLCWDVVMTSRARGEMFRVLVDAQSGEVLVRRCLTEYISDATYRVYTGDSPSPFSPGNSTPSTTQPPLTSRTLLTLSALDTNASPSGWIDDGVNETRGNNVDAHKDANADNVPDLPRPQGSPFRVFDFPLDLSQPPNTYANAAVVQLFYWNNFMHDKLYQLGFTEAAGNFQNNNFGRGGLGNDAVQADAQDGSGVNNANFSTPPDGSPGRMQMYIFNYPSPDRDGDLDAEIVLHEYTHGLSNRRVGGGVGLSALQSRGMGEGWSDFYALALLSESTDAVNGTYAAGGYATYQLNGLTQNYYFGIRRYPYCTDMSKNPLTFKDIDPAQASSHSGVPRSPIIGATANEVHNMGEVWCVTLHEARMSLITKYGWATGNQLMLQLVTDGMTLSPANPNFLQARDAIIQADLVNTGGANQTELWTAFAKRGMGFSATSPASSTTTGLHEAFDLPDALGITPFLGLVSSGPVGGPFSPAVMAFTLTNNGTTILNWSLSSTSSWFSVSPSSGTLTNGGANDSVNITVLPAANALPAGTHAATIRFTNTTSGFVLTRTVTLNAVGLGMADDFDPGIDLTQWSSFGGTVGSTVLATNFGTFVSAPNSLWFGDGGTRHATTTPSIQLLAGPSPSLSALPTVDPIHGRIRICLERASFLKLPQTAAPLGIY